MDTNIKLNKNDLKILRELIKFYSEPTIMPNLNNVQAVSKAIVTLIRDIYRLTIDDSDIVNFF